MAIQSGDTVSVHYTGRLETGEVFDSSEGKDPLTFVVGSGQLIPGFDRAVLGKEAGDKAEAVCPPEEAYGAHDPERLMEIPKDRLQGVDAEVGQVLGLEDEQGNPHMATVAAIADESITLDFNHFLAGKTLMFEIEIVSVA